MARLLAGPSGEGHSRPQGAPADRASPELCEEQPPPPAVEKGGGREKRGTERTRGDHGRGTARAQGQHPDPTRLPWELPGTWCSEICLLGYTNKRNHLRAGFRMTNNWHWNSSSPKESNADLVACYSPCIFIQSIGVDHLFWSCAFWITLCEERYLWIYKRTEQNSLSKSSWALS